MRDGTNGGGSGGGCRSCSGGACKIRTANVDVENELVDKIEDPLAEEDYKTSLAENKKDFHAPAVKNVMKKGKKK